MKYAYDVVRYKFLKDAGSFPLTLKAGHRIIQVIEKAFESDGVVLAVLIEKET